MTFRNLLDTLDRPVLTLPVGDKNYVIAEATGETFLRLVEMQTNMAENPRSDSEVMALALGDDLYAQVQAELSQSQVQVVGLTAYFWQLRMHDLAEEFWNSGGKALRDRVPTPTRTRRATPSGAATSTRRRASGSGTSTRKKSKGNAPG